MATKEDVLKRLQIRSPNTSIERSTWFRRLQTGAWQLKKMF
ncbi:hypothetical protein QUA70_23970 [Microcoleus sp. LAD1_D5]